MADTEARLLILEAFEFWRQEQVTLATVADLNFVDLYEKRQIILPEWVYESCPAISRSTLHRWRKLYKQQSLGKRNGKRYQLAS
ncbi:hypothetical protein [Pseudanabaena sp. PCC 6802]|uniref:hypothetical protein n=1 Tax=Pseudanabaena sp. PCC 6802 TaxID=118173 RepID=UPI0012E9A04E|nr:hypothetical protein [Pseudanabaena sp. PCC 6802]